MPRTVETFTNDRLKPTAFPDMARKTSGRFVANATFAKGQAVGRVTSSGLLTAYNSGASDGSQVCLGFTEFAFRTDANGAIFLGDETPTDSQRAVALTEAPYFIAGTFNTTELAGYDANALTNLRGRVIAPNVIYIP